MGTPLFESYIIPDFIQHVPVNPITPYRFSISQQEALDDLRHLKYILDTAYSGREYWEKQGYSFQKSYLDIESFILGSDKSILIEDLLSEIAHAFCYIHDGHLSISAPNGRIHSFAYTFKAFFADVLLEKNKTGFRVVISKCDDLPIGYLLSEDDVTGLLFPTISPPGQQHYLLGSRIWRADTAGPSFNQQILSLSINGEKLHLPMHPCRASECSLQNGVFSFESRGKIPIVKSSRFWESEDVYIETLAAEFMRLGYSLRNAPCIIWDIHDNRGGNSDYPKNFLTGLNEYATWPIDCAVLSSPAIQQARGWEKPYSAERKWDFYPAVRGKGNKGKYNGVMFLLISEQVGSSGEAAVSMAMNVPNLVTIGESTGGRGVFGETLSYMLDNSKLVLTVPHKLFLSGAEEGVGYSPDFWLDSPFILDETIRWLESPDNYLAPINGHLPEHQ